IEAGRSVRSEPDHQIGRAKSRQAEGRAGNDRKRAATQRGGSVGERSASPVGEHKAGVGSRTNRYRAKIQIRRQNSQLWWRNTDTSNRIGANAPVTREEQRIAEAAGGGRIEADDQIGRAKSRQAKRC